MSVSLSCILYVYVCLLVCLSDRLSCSAIHVSFEGLDVSYCSCFFVFSECVSVLFLSVCYSFFLRAMLPEE